MINNGTIRCHAKDSLSSHAISDFLIRDLKLYLDVCEAAKNAVQIKLNSASLTCPSCSHFKNKKGFTDCSYFVSPCSLTDFQPHIPSNTNTNLKAGGTD